MTETSPDPLLDRLTPAVTDYKSGAFELKAELDCLMRVRSVAAQEAVVLYCSRILEVLTADALRKIDLEPSTNLFSNLDALQQYNLMPLSTLYWANALRRTGNQVRHVLGRITRADAELGLLFTETCLHWFIHDVSKAEITRDGQPLGLGGNPKVRELIASLESLNRDFETGLKRINPDSCAELWEAAALPAVLAEKCLDSNRFDEARRVLDMGRTQFPGDLRLGQLWGLYWSRKAVYPQALEILERLYDQRPEDEETAGITAGVYKRFWVKDRTHTEYLEKSHRAYRQGWKVSRRSSAYLGINAASTALWLGKADHASQIAGEVRKHLHDRMSVLSRHYELNPEIKLNYWDQVTLAEAALLLGHPDEARRLYNQAFARHAGDRSGGVDSTRMQLGALLPYVGFAGGVDTFLKG